jgi:hypothetical protein
MPTNTGGIILRLLTAVAGVGLLAVTTDYSIQSGVGYGHPWARVMIAMAVVGAIGAAAFGHLWGHGKRMLALLLCLVLIVIEATAFVTTAERVVTQRDAQQSPAIAAAEIRRVVTGRVIEAEARLASIPATTDRLTTALAQKLAADKAAIDKAAERSCAANCRALLEQQTTAADREVQTARAELAEQRRLAEQALDAARKELAALPTPKTASALSDRLGVSGWLWDLVMGAMNSIATNVGACVMIAVAAHWPRPMPLQRDTVQSIKRRTIEVEDLDTVDTPPTSRASAASKVSEATRPPVEVAKLEIIDTCAGSSKALLPVPPVNLVQHVDDFAYETIKPKARGSITLVQAHSAYVNWCEARGIEPIDPGDFAETLGKLIKGAGLKVRQGDEGPVILGVRLETRALKAA